MVIFSLCRLNAYSAACCILQMMDALDIVNSNLADATESWAVCQTDVESMQCRLENPDVSDLLWTAGGDCTTNTSMQKTSVEGSLQPCSQHPVNTTSQSSEPSGVGELVDRSDNSSSKSARSSAQASRTKSPVSRLVSDVKRQPGTPAVKSKNSVVTSQKDVAVKTPAKKPESTGSSVKKAGPTSYVGSRTPSVTGRGSFDLSGSRSSTPLSSCVSNSTTRRPSVPKQTFKQPALPGVGKQQNLAPRKLSAASAPGCASLSGQKTASESSLAAGDFTDLSAAAGCRSSTPVTSSLGDSNDPSSISRVSSVSDGSSPAASHAGSSCALSTSVFQPPKPSSSTGRLQHCLTC